MGFAAHLRELRSYRHLLRNLVACDLKLKYKGSVLGLAWSLANPLMMLAVYTIAFDYILQIRVENFPLFFFIGYLPWTFLSNSLTMSAVCIVSNGALLNKIYFPRAILPLSIVLSNAFQFLLAAVCLLPVLWWVGMPLGRTLFAFPLVFLLQFAFAFGLSELAAVSHTFFRDTRHLLDVLLTIWFWMTPIVYPTELVPDVLRPWIELNPMTSYLRAYRALALYGQWPDIATLVSTLVWSAVALMAGSVVFNNHSRRFAELV